MPKKLWQVRFQIDGLVPAEVKLKRKFWLKKGEILLEKKGKSLDVHLLHEGERTRNSEEKILPYLKFTPLISNNKIELEGGSGKSIASTSEFGKDTTDYLTGKLIVSNPKEAIPDIERHVPGFLTEIRRLHDTYIEIVNENKFLSLAIDFFYDANNKTIFNDEGFIFAVICLEALFNEGKSDIKYKIAHRAGFIIGLHNNQAVDVFKNIKTIYNERNNLIHGGRALDSKNSQVRHEIDRYARTSIMIFLTLLKNSKRRNLKKDRKLALLNEIDYAMLDPEKRDALQKEIKQGMKKFDLKVPRTFEGKRKQGIYRITAW